MAADLQVPSDIEAERAMVGIVLSSALGYEAASHWITPEDFYDHQNRVAFTAAARVGPPPADPPEWIVDSHAICGTLAHRIVQVAHLTGQDRDELARIAMFEAPIADPNGCRYARRVADAARARRVMRYAADLFNGLGRGASLDEVIEDARRIEAEFAPVVMGREDALR